MSRKFYIITTLIDGIAYAVSSKAVTSPSADSGATGSQIDDIRNSGVQVLAHTTPGIWLRRASARSAAAYLTSATGNDYRVKEVGDFKRNVRPVKGYRFLRSDGGGEWYNEAIQGPHSRAAMKAEVDGLIPTRALARAALPEQQISANKQTDDKGKVLKLSIETVYADA